MGRQEGIGHCRREYRKHVGRGGAAAVALALTRGQGWSYSIFLSLCCLILDSKMRDFPLPPIVKRVNMINGL